MTLQDLRNDFYRSLADNAANPAAFSISVANELINDALAEITTLASLNIKVFTTSLAQGIDSIDLSTSAGGDLANINKVSIKEASDTKYTPLVKRTTMFQFDDVPSGKPTSYIRLLRNTIHFDKKTDLSTYSIKTIANVLPAPLTLDTDPVPYTRSEQIVIRNSALAVAFAMLGENDSAQLFSALVQRAIARIAIAYVPDQAEVEEGFP